MCTRHVCTFCYLCTWAHIQTHICMHALTSVPLMHMHVHLYIEIFIWVCTFHKYLNMKKPHELFWVEQICFFCCWSFLCGKTCLSDRVFCFFLGVFSLIEGLAAGHLMAADHIQKAGFVHFLFRMMPVLLWRYWKHCVQRTCSLEKRCVISFHEYGKDYSSKTAQSTRLKEHWSTQKSSVTSMGKALQTLCDLSQKLG